MNFNDNLRKILQRYEDIVNKMSSNPSADDYIKLSKEYAELTPIVSKINDYNKADADLFFVRELLSSNDIDHDTKTFAIEEEHKLEKLLKVLYDDVKISLLPKDEADNKSAIIEIRAGTGGEEAGLFAALLFNMYQKYSESKGWKFEILSISDTGIGGYKEATALIKGFGVFSQLKFESGVHRVQRIPETESNGRIHTSAATVAVLPEAEEIDIILEDKDLKIETCRASGAGGQHVNTTDSSVKITHLPTGITVNQQDEKSQHKNKAKALKILRSRVFELERQKKQQERADVRKEQIGSGDRSERIRTYNFPQSRVSDHRINLTLYKIHEIMNGDLDEIINALIADYEAVKLAQGM